MQRLRPFLAGSALVASGFVAALALGQVMPESPMAHGAGEMGEGGAMTASSDMGGMHGKATGDEADGVAAPMNADQMPEMDHSGAGGMSPSAEGKTATSGGGADHSTMAGMSRSSGSAAASPGGRAGTMGPGAMAGMDHSGMAGMNSSESMAGASRTRSTRDAMAEMDRRDLSPAPSASSGSGAMAGMDHGSMAGMSTSSGKAGMPGMPGMGGMSMLSNSSPTDGQTLSATPPALTLFFAQPMRLESLQVFNSAGSRVPLPLASSATPSNSIAIQLPALAPDSYEARWRAVNSDGQSGSGSVRFNVGTST